MLNEKLPVHDYHMANNARAARLVADEIFGQLGRRRSTRGWLTKRTGISEATLNHRLNGLSPFTIDELVVIASTLDVSLMELIRQLIPQERSA